MHSTYLRKEHLHGLMIGVAIGDALGYSREGLDRRVALKMFGRPPLRYALLPGRGIYSDDTQLMLLSAQALLNSRSDMRLFRRAFQRRLSWYLLSLPVGVGRGTLKAAAKCWLMRIKSDTGVNSAGNGAATRAIFSALAINGSGHRLNRWIEQATKLTHTHPLAIDGCQVLAALADYGATHKPHAFDAFEALSRATDVSKQPEIKDRLSELAPFLERKRSPSAVARHFEWDRGIMGFMVPTTVMATYCWLRYPDNFRRAVESAITLGGDSDSLAAIVGGLVGAHVGYSQLPQELVRRLGGFPHSPGWIQDLAERLSHWPHGVDDLHVAPALSSDSPFQLIRNGMTIPLVLLHVGLRVPFRLLTRSQPKRSRR
jgi:ADP-ribosyl-[dinitrogen reductase] hydrolase